MRHETLSQILSGSDTPSETLFNEASWPLQPLIKALWNQCPQHVCVLSTRTCWAYLSFERQTGIENGGIRGRGVLLNYMMDLVFERKMNELLLSTQTKGSPGYISQHLLINKASFFPSFAFLSLPPLAAFLSLSHLYLSCSDLFLIHTEGAEEALQWPTGLSIILAQRKWCFLSAKETAFTLFQKIWFIVRSFISGRQWTVTSRTTLPVWSSKYNNIPKRKLNEVLKQ